MYFLYVDETGDPGDPNRVGNPGSKDYTLGVFMISPDQWASAHNKLVAFRRQLRSSFRIPMKTEIKANHLVSGGGLLNSLHLSDSQRRYIFSQHLRMIGAVSGQAFAIHVDKRDLMRRDAQFDASAKAWELLFQRLARTYTGFNPPNLTPFHVSHDEGQNAIIRKHARKARRYLTAGQMYGPSTVRLPTDWLIDDPVPRNSQDSLFIQLADLVAWAASRTVIPPLGRRALAVAPQWNRHIGAAAFAPVNAQARQTNPQAPVGIVIYK